MAIAISDPFALKQGTVPDAGEVDIVAALEKELRAEKKEDVKTQQSQHLGGSGLELPDAPGQNQYLKAKAEKYAMQDNVPEGAGTRSVLGDFSFILDMTSMAAEQNSSFASNQTMAMAFSTLANAQSSAEKIVESQFAYNLAASSFGLKERDKKSVSNAKKHNRMGNNSMY